jgi:hypothetical protein
MEMTPTEKINKMMAEAYSQYTKSLRTQNDANKYRANFWKGKYEGHRESLAAIESEKDTRIHHRDTEG